ncbi:hypothetical protein CKM354_000298600 [Cercospora kikuchii]|uniref:Uncharacterized protein n=1 Tax=Cercospora kikuchii TaxID=84275 RepID=A0A9P3CDY1_9PEZI|nr:uncharacterized protein CKM354_000298600 [Cercospora kikuchii]GIZ39607.1 hypothetical protein CKM354_000298600 [Cercospora kikuchii]
MERGASPMPSSCHSSQDLGRYRKSSSTASYRLFPQVEPTPPASPVHPAHLQKAGLHKALSYRRRRSSSLDNASRDSACSSTTTGTQPAPTPPPTLSTRDCRKVSLPEIRPLQTVVELDSAAAEPSPQLFDSAAVRAHDLKDDHVHIRPASAQGGSLTARSAERAPIIGNARHEDRAIAHPAREASHSQAAALGGFHLQTPASTIKPKRSKPNLRIKVVGKKSGDASPSPPVRALAQARDEPDQPEVLLGTTGSGLDPARLASRPTTSASHQQSLGDSRPSVTAHELTNASKAATGRHSRKLWPRTLSKEGLSSHAPQPRRAECDSSDRPVRPSTAGAPSRSPPPAPGPMPVDLVRKSAMHRPPDATQSNRQSRLPARLRSFRSVEQLTSGDGSAISAPFGSTAVAPGHTTAAAQRVASPTLDVGRFPERISSMDYRGHNGNHTVSHQQEPHGDVKNASRSSLMRPEATTALAIARANVAALRKSVMESPGLFSGSQSQPAASDSGSLSRSFTPDALSRLAPSDDNDPVTILKDMTQQCDALHARYASLRAERQKLSSGIIEKMQQATNQEAMSALLNEQLSLAAISSSMDICFAKLKSLECRKEDAIAALIAQTTEARKSPSDNIAAIIASMSPGSRKSSLTRTAETDSRYAYSSRSSPEPRDRDSHTSTQSTLPTTISASSETASMEYRLSFTPSLRFDAALQLDFLAPETIPEAVESPVARTAEQQVTVRPRDQASDGMILSPTRFVRPQASSSPQVGAQEDSSKFDVDEKQFEAISQDDDDDDSDDSSFKHSERVPGSKAAKFLGLLNKDGRPSPAVPMPRELAHLASVPNATYETHTQTPLSSKAASISLATPMETADPLAMQDFSAQLESFPKPSELSARVRSRAPKDLLIPNPLALNPPTPMAETFPDSFDRHDDFVRPPRRDSAMPASHKIVKRTMTQGSTRTTHTIQVYLGQDDLELFDLYRRGSEGLITEPVPVS